MKPNPDIRGRFLILPMSFNRNIYRAVFAAVLMLLLSAVAVGQHSISKDDALQHGYIIDVLTPTSVNTFTGCGIRSLDMSYLGISLEAECLENNQQFPGAQPKSTNIEATIFVVGMAFWADCKLIGFRGERMSFTCLSDPT